MSEVGVDAASYATLKRQLPVCATPSWRQSLVAATARHARLGPASLVLYDVSTLYFETDAGDGFREPGFSEELKLEPQITLGCSPTRRVPAHGRGIRGHRAETATMLPSHQGLQGRQQLGDVTVRRLCALITTPAEYYENRLFNAAAAAEGFHTALFPDSTGLPPAAHESGGRQARFITLLRSIEIGP